MESSIRYNIFRSRVTLEVGYMCHNAKVLTAMAVSVNVYESAALASFSKFKPLRRAFFRLQKSFAAHVVIAA